MWSKPPLALTLMSHLFNFSCFGPKSWGMSLLLGRTVPHEFTLRLSKSSESLGDEKKLSINILCPKPSTLLVKCLTVVCVAVMSSVVECESLPKYTLMSYVYRFITEFVNFDVETFCFLWNLLPEDNPALKFYNYLVHCQILQGVIEFSTNLVQLVRDSP